MTTATIRPNSRLTIEVNPEAGQFRKVFRGQSEGWMPYDAAGRTSGLYLYPLVEALKGGGRPAEITTVMGETVAVEWN